MGFFSAHLLRRQSQLERDRLADGGVGLFRRGRLYRGGVDASAFYGKLQERLEQNQPLPEGALPQLGARRAAAIVAALKETGVNAAAIQTAAPEKTDAAIGKPVALKLGLAAK